jgi:bla regulator protein BlaR1
MASELVRILMLATLASSIAMLLVLVVRKPMRGRFGARAAYALWILVPLSALVVILPAPIASLSMPLAPQAVAALVTATSAAVLPAESPFDVSSWLASAWLLGSGIVFVLFFRQQRRFVRRLGKLSPASDEALRAQSTAGCPALLGAWRPRVVVPADFEERYNLIERKLILAHERTHRARGDAQVNALAAALRCVFWFNPLIHFVASRFRFDQELACDAVVISRFPEARRSYADAMLKTQLAVLGLPVGCHWQSSHPLKERIAMLKQPLPGRARTALGAGIAVALIIGGTYAAWAVQPASTPAAVKHSGATTTHANITWTVDSGPAHVIPLESLDEPFSIHEGEPDNPWDLQGTVTPGKQDTFEFNVILRRAGAIVSNPKLIVRRGTSGEIRIGKETGGKFEGIAVQIALGLADADSPALKLSDTPPTENPSFRRYDAPKYPKAAVDAHQSGKVILKVQVDEKGNVQFAEVEKADPPEAKAVFAEASVAAVMQWKFNPAKKNGKAVSGWVQVPIDFALDDDDKG